MKIKEIQVYTIDELTPEAQEKARQNYIADEDYPFLEEDMNYKLDELLKEEGITSDKTKVYYSLSCCQGDGAMFEGYLKWKNYTVNIKHSGHYYHSNSKTLEILEDTEEQAEADKTIYDLFEVVYYRICKELERYGYDVIETNDSMENFMENCRANDYTFTLSGKMENI